MLKDMYENGGMRNVDDIDYRDRFDRKWNEFTPEEQRAIDAEINRLLDALIDDPNPNWGSIMNTSIEGGKVNPFSGQPGDWTGTPWHPIWERHGRSDEQAALFFGTLWKLRIIERPEQWIGVRNTEDRPTFQNRGITLPGKTREKKSGRTGATGGLSASALRLHHWQQAASGTHRAWQGGPSHSGGGSNP